MPQDVEAPSWTDVNDALSDLEMAAGWEPRDGGNWAPPDPEDYRLAALAQAMVFHEAGIRNRDDGPMLDVLRMPDVRPLEECVAVVDASVGNPVGPDEPLSDHLSQAALLYLDLTRLEEAAGVPRLTFSSFAQRLADVSATLELDPKEGMGHDTVESLLESLETNMNVPAPVEGTPAQRAAALAARIDPDSLRLALPHGDGDPMEPAGPAVDAHAASTEVPGTEPPQPMAGPLRAEDIPSF